MTPGVMNEIFQWLAIGGVFLVALAMYRQLGVMMTDSRTYFTEKFGPAVNARIGSQYTAIFADAPPVKYRLLLFVTDECPACEHLIEHLPEFYEAYGEPTAGGVAPLRPQAAQVQHVLLQLDGPQLLGGHLRGREVPLLRLLLPWGNGGPVLRVLRAEMHLQVPHQLTSIPPGWS